jgi:hypothetical protein
MNSPLLGLSAAALALSGASPVSRQAQIQQLAPGETLPALSGEYLTGRPALLPRDACGRVTLLLLGFTYDSRFPVEAWTKRFRQEFEKNPKVAFYEIPMIGGLARLGKWFIDSGMRQGTPKADQGNVITVYGGTDWWKQRVAFGDPKAAYLLLIDKTGKIVWQYAGDFDEKRYQELSAEVSKWTNF